MAEPYPFPKPQAKTHSFNVMLSNVEFSRLDAMATAAGVAKSLIIRQCLEARYQMQVQQIPTCADGNRCSCPHLIQARPAQQYPHA